MEVTIQWWDLHRFVYRQVHWKTDLIEQLTTQSSHRELTTQSSHRGLGQLVCDGILQNRNLKEKANEVYILL